MRKSILIGSASFLLGVAVLFAFLRFSPSASESLLGVSAPKEHKPIPSALNLRPQEEEEQAPPSGQAQARPTPKVPPLFDQDDEDLLNGQDPFVAMRKLHQQFQQQLAHGFDMEEASQQIVAKEDAKSVSYEIDNVDATTLDAKVQNGYLSISANTKKQEAGFSMVSSFHQTFPLPRNVDASKMETISEKDKVVLRFPKRNT